MLRTLPLISATILAIVFSVSVADAQLYINEFLASNATGITDEAGDFEDWIEIYNAGNTDIDLAGHYISDDALEPLIWQIPATNSSLTTVPAGGYLILWADKDTDDGENHIDIKLGAGGEDIVLTASDGITVLDQLTFGPQSEDVSYGRITDGDPNFQFFSTPTPGAENIDSGVPTYTITLNVPIASGNDDGEEFSGGGVTLLSSDIEMVQDGGSVFTPAFRFTNVALPADAIINNAYIQFYAEEVQVGACDLTIRAENIGDAPPLQSTNSNISGRTTTTASASWIPAPWSIIGDNGPDQASPDLTALVEEIIANPGWTEGNAMAFIMTGSGTRTTYAYDSNPDRVARLIIEAEVPLPTDPIPAVFVNEVAANSSSFLDESGTKEDWVEIYNPNTEDVDLGGLFLTDDFGNLDKWQISPGTIVPAGGFLVFFTDNDDSEGPLHTNFSLKAGGEEVALVQLLATGLTIIDSMSYEDMPFLATYGRETDGANNLVFFGAVTPEASNNGAELYLPSPVFSIPSGSYSVTQSVTISSPEPGTSIYYTTDGSLPDVNSILYNGSAINVSSTQSLRAISTKAGHTNSQPSDATYLVNENHNIPILYITTDPDNFFDDEIGIYVDGTNGVIAYCATEPVNWARDWERPINLKMFLPDGSLAFDVDAGAEINGACSRNRAMKSLGINLRDKEFGDDAIEYPLFPEREHEDYQRLKLRNSGQDFIRLGFRDMVNQNLITGKLDIDLQAGRPSLLYINGEFWGIHNIREKYAGEYFEAIYGVNENDLDIIKSPGLPWRDVKKGSDVIYNTLFDVVESSDMNNQADWDYFQSQVDVNEMMNYWITMTYMNNYDWPANNLTVWRERADGAKWRYGMADTDGSTQNNLTGDAEPEFNKFELINDPNVSNWPNHSNSTLFLRKSLDRSDFRDEFIQRACSVMELIYDPGRTNQFTDEIVALFQPNVQNHIDRWGFDNAMGGSVASWEEWIALYRDFYERRPAFFRQHMNDFYGLDGYYDLTISFDENSGGDVFVNTNEMEIPYNYEGTYFKNLPLQLKAVAKPGFVFQFWLETGETEPIINFIASSNATMTPIFELLDCDNIPSGTPCNDGDVCTTNDVYDDVCNCAGTFADEDNDGVCDAEDQCSGFDDNIDLNNNGIPDGCDVNCTDNDGDLICEEDDCDDNNPNVPTAPGTPCDDGNAQTDNDTIQDDGCTCQGEITPPIGEYCDAQGDAPWLEWIAGVQLNDLSNTSGKSQYSDFTDQFASLEGGSSYAITLTSGFSWTAYEEYFRVWIDYDQNGVFDEPTEIAYSGIISGIPNATPTADLIGNIDVPANALTGTTRMRVSMQRGAYAAPCGSFPNGEVEDYSIIISEGNGAILTLNNCPNDIAVTAPFGQNSMIVNWTTPTASTTCDPNTITLNQTAGPPSGSAFNTGSTTTIAYLATDECGNQETCTFTVTVNAASNGEITLNCPNNFTVIIPPGETAAVVSWVEPTGSTTCPIGGLIITQNGGSTNGSLYTSGIYLINYSSVDDCGNTETCAFSVTVVESDNGSITLNCPANIEATALPGDTGVVVSWNEATGSTTCPIGGLTIAQDGGSTNGNLFLIGTHQIDYSASDDCGNIESCSFTITVNPPDLGSITLTCPSNITVTALPGETNASVSWTEPVGSTSCPIGGLSVSQDGGSTNGNLFLIGTHQINYSATDDCGNNESCSFIITVNPPDLGSITLTCPSNITVTALPGETNASVSWTEPMGSTSCPIGGLSVTQDGGSTNGNLFPVGTYQINYSATDDCGNNESCSFTITVLPDVMNSEYCEAEGDFPWHEWIANVQLNTINNPSSKTAYSDFTDVSTTLSTSMSYDLILTSAYSWTTYDEYWKVWIDYNQNGVFEEPGEIAFSGLLPAPPNGTDNAIINGLVTVPANANPGATRMRVAMKRGAEPGPCETFGFGEVEDYTVVILDSTPPTLQAFANASSEIQLFPNPAEREVTFILKEKMEVERIEVFNISTQQVFQMKGNEGEQVYRFAVNYWTGGMYFLRLKLSDGRLITKRFVVSGNY